MLNRYAARHMAARQQGQNKKLFSDIGAFHCDKKCVQSQGCIRREGTSEAAPEAVRQAVGGGSKSGWGRLLSVKNAVGGGAGKAAPTVRETVAGSRLGALEGAGGGLPPPNASLPRGHCTVGPIDCPYSNY